MATERRALRWFTLRDGTTIGFVAVIDEDENYFKVYIGRGKGADEADDIARIAIGGTPILEENLARLLMKNRRGGDRYFGLPYAY